ncbi:hypothetical protein BJX61DRAFT_547243 [Aspergillus egyptiacus]|nr:hypothetical protein BJX61DRAFT_547243 [Aspergillus egyptiacus]
MNPTETTHLDYLQQRLPFIPIPASLPFLPPNYITILEHEPPTSTSSMPIPLPRLTSLTCWESFNLTHILDLHKLYLEDAKITCAGDFPTDLPRLESKWDLCDFVEQHIQPRVQDALDVGIRYIKKYRKDGYRSPRGYRSEEEGQGHDQEQDQNEVEVEEEEEEETSINDRITIFRRMNESRDLGSPQPDFRCVVVNTQTGLARVNVVGVVKPSWDWNTDMEGGDVLEKTEFQFLLRRLMRLMRRSGAAFGFVLTEQEMVAARWGKGGGAGELEISEPMRWSCGGTVEDPKMTVLLGLWYLAMLAARESGRGCKTH